MTDYNDSGQERTDLEITVCTNGVVNVNNPKSDRAHSVMLDGEGNAVRCSCKGHRFRGHCYHTGEVETRPLVVASAATASSRRVATDGGYVEDEGETCAQCGREGVDGYVCERCIAESERKRATDTDEPTRSEQPDMGGGESTGVVDLE